MDAQPWIVALDVGSSSTRALVYTGVGGRPVRRARVSYPADASDEALAVDVYLRAVETALDGVEAFLASRERRADAVAVSVFWHSVYVTTGGCARTPLLRWDTRHPAFAAAARELRRRVDAERVRQAVGAPVHPSFPAGKALALLAPFRGAHGLMLEGLEAALARTLFGTREISVSMASATGLYDNLRLTWHAEVLEALGLSAAHLPVVVPSGEDVRRLGQDGAHRWPHLADAVWHLPRGDGALSNVGLGAFGEHVWGLTAGTSAALRRMDAWPASGMPAVHAAPRAELLPTALFRYRFDETTFVVGGALSAAGNLLAWVRRRFPASRSGGRPAEGREPDASEAAGDWRDATVRVVPHLWGERSPDWPDAAWGGVVGLAADTPGEHVERAAMASVAAGLGVIAQALRTEAAGCDRQEATVIHAGGRTITSSPLLRQMIADAVGLPVVCPAGSEESSARGAWVLAAQTLGLSAPPPHGGVRSQPRPGADTAYLELWEELARIQAALPGPWDSA